MSGARLTRRFYRRDPVTVAKALLGHELVRVLDDGTELSGRIVETEAYLGIPDKAAHSYGGRRTQRNESMYLDGGHAYVYFVYGMHWCFNVVTDRTDVPTACLIRGLEPLEGLGSMKRRRARSEVGELCSGPAKLTQALGIDRSVDGVDLVTSEEVFIRTKAGAASFETGPRVGVAYAEEWSVRPLRFFVPRGGRKAKGPAGTAGPSQ